MELAAFTTLLAIFLSLSLPSATPQETVAGDEWGFSYVHGSETGPENWGKINEEWALCETGGAQSPVDISYPSVVISPSLGELNRSYSPSNAFLRNRGYDVQLRFEGDAGAISINGTQYNLLQMHWHTPSEHSNNGHQFPTEIHMVHQSAEQGIAVVGVLYDIGPSDPFLAKLEPYIAKISGSTGAEAEVGVVHPWEVGMCSREYYRYMGSLTTPPCSEGVVWTIIRQVRTVSRYQVDLLRNALQFQDGSKINARPIQQINNRFISLYRPENIKASTSDVEQAEVKSWVN